MFADAGRYLFHCGYWMVVLGVHMLEDGLWLCVWQECACIQVGSNGELSFPRIPIWAVTESYPSLGYLYGQ